MSVSSINRVDAAAIRQWYQDYLTSRNGGTAPPPDSAPAPAPAPAAAAPPPAPALPAVAVETPLTPRLEVDLVGAARRLAMGVDAVAAPATGTAVGLLTLRKAAMAATAGSAPGRSPVGEQPTRIEPASPAPVAADARSRAEIIARASYGLVAEAGAADQVKALLRSA